MNRRLIIDIPNDLPPPHRSDKTLREAMKIEIDGLKMAKQAIDEAAEALGVPHRDPVGD
ncbi:hypothetical protein [Dongia rigui]|uniref:Uncharacterized protein n=1 Tax=Dongia rigui TaxID=940149 RepID=A0ABU5DVH2_9PROT|nr:hypothetical protein [Dongia rigui]MDY0870982.1 hypothetical protein [Dongia rigui]